MSGGFEIIQNLKKLLHCVSWLLKCSVNHPSVVNNERSSTSVNFGKLSFQAPGPCQLRKKITLRQSTLSRKSTNARKVSFTELLMAGQSLASTSS